MKLGELRGAIRTFKGNPVINLFPIPNSDFGMKVTLQKTPLLAELERVYPGGKAVETGFEFDVDTGVLRCPECDEATALTREEKAAAFAGSTTGKSEAAVDIIDIDLVGDDDLDLFLEPDEIDDLDDLDLDFED